MGRESVIEAAATRAQQTIEWLESHTFMPEEQLGNWAHVVGYMHPLLLLEIWQRDASVYRCTCNDVRAAGMHLSCCML